MSKKEVEDSQHRFTVAKPPVPKRGKTTFLDGINVSSTEETQAKLDEIYYGPKAKILGEADNKLGSFARKTLIGKKTIYEVKFATAGPSVGRMLDPNGLFFSVGDELKFEKNMGRQRYEFRKVTEGVFDAYIKFLETGSQKYLHNAERESMNGTA